MAKESCNLIGRMHISVDILNFVNLFVEKTLLFLEESIDLSFWIILYLAILPDQTKALVAILG